MIVPDTLIGRTRKEVTAVISIRQEARLSCASGLQMIREEETVSEMYPNAGKMHRIVPRMTPVFLPAEAIDVIIDLREILFMERIVIISDEPEIRNQLTDRVRRILGEGLQIRQQTGRDASSQCKDADLVFIHTRMSRASSLEVARRMKKANPAPLLIFFSENQEDVDFILGSDFDSFLWLRDPVDRLPAMLQTFEARFAANLEHFVRIKRRNRRQLLPKSSILYVERDYRKIIFHMDDGELISIYSTLDEVLQELDDSWFRIHNSYVVQETAIRELHRDFLKLKDGSLIPVSRTYAAQAKQRIIPAAKA